MGVAVLTVAAVNAPAAGSASAGNEVYDKSCKICHGAAGQANPGIAKALQVEIPNPSGQERHAI